MLIRSKLLLVAGVITCAMAAAHVFVGQAHLARVLNAELENIDRAIMFAAWHMVTVVLLAAGIELTSLSLCSHAGVVRPVALALAIVFGLFAVVFVLASFLFEPAALQWVPMLLVSILSLLGYATVERSPSPM